MKVLNSLWVAFSLIISTAANERCPAPCDLSDEKCITCGAHNVFLSVVTGTSGLNKPMNPLSIQSVNCKGISPNYKISDVVLEGLSNCVTTKGALDVPKKKFQLNLRCSKLVAYLSYEVKEGLFSPLVDKKVTLIVRETIILNNGRYAVIVNPIDHMSHYVIQDYNTNVFFGDISPTFRPASNAKVNELNHVKQSFLPIFIEIIKEAMVKVIDGLNNYSRTALRGKF